MLAIWGSCFQYFLVVSPNKRTVCARFALWILEAFIVDFSAELSRAAGLKVAPFRERLPPASGNRFGPSHTLGADSKYCLTNFCGN
jgi:hypothetical protein